MAISRRAHGKLCGIRNYYYVSSIFRIPLYALVALVHQPESAPSSRGTVLLPLTIISNSARKTRQTTMNGIKPSHFLFTIYIFGVRRPGLATESVSEVQSTKATAFAFDRKQILVFISIYLCASKCGCVCLCECSMRGATPLPWPHCDLLADDFQSPFHLSSPKNWSHFPLAERFCS